MGSLSIKRLMLVAFCVCLCAIGCEQLGIRIGKPNLPEPQRVDQGVSLGEKKTVKTETPTRPDVPSSSPAIVPAATPPVVPFTEWTFAESAADAVGRIGGPSIPALIEALDSDHAILRQKAALIIGRIGPDAAEAVPALIKRLNDADLGVRLAVTRALGQIGPEAAPAVKRLMQIIEQDARSQG